MSDAVEIDARGMRCPWPVLRVAKAMRTSSDVVVLADDSIAPQELAALATEKGWAYVPVDDPRGPAFRLTRRASD